MRLAVIVLGDVGRSPRMQYHARAAARFGFDVDLIGERGAAPHPSVRSEPRLALREIEASSARARHPRLASAAAATVSRVMRFTRVVFARRPRPDVLLVQVPPCLPTLSIALLAARAHRAKLVVDWHNFESAMLSIRLGAKHPVVRSSIAFERRLGRRADAHFCVSAAMRAVLAQRIGVEAEVLPDRPEQWFSPTSTADRRRLFDRHALTFREMESDRTALIVTSTSWTADEDLPLLLEALRRLDDRVEAQKDGCAATFPDLLVVISGRGELRESFERAAAQTPLRHARVRTIWLDAEDYPRFLGSAALGLSFHRSASGVDLAMKVADMQGAGLPVCALDYGHCLREQVRHGENGLLFSTAEQLADQLHELFRGFPEDAPWLDRLRVRVLAERGDTWCDAWRRTAGPLLMRLASAP